MSERRISHQDRIETAKLDRFSQIIMACSATALSIMCASEAFRDGFDAGKAAAIAALAVLTPITWRMAERENERIVELQTQEKNSARKIITYS